MNKQEQILARFLRQESSSKQIGKYILRFAGKGRKGCNVEEFEIVEALSADDLDRFAETIYARAQDHADGMGPSSSPYRYTVSSVIVVEGEAPRESAQAVFRVRGDSDLEIDGEEEGGEEAPTMKGLLSQLMRHNEANNRTLVGAFGQFMMASSRREEKQSEMIDHLLEQRRKDQEAVEAARTEEWERQMVTEQERNKQARIDYGLKKIALLAPVALSHLTGGKMGSEVSSEGLIVKELMGTITPEQVAVLMKVLKPEQQLAFFRLFELMKESNKAIEEGKEDGDQMH